MAVVAINGPSWMDYIALNNHTYTRGAGSRDELAFFRRVGAWQ